jgi:hypothetical protein
MLNSWVGLNRHSGSKGGSCIHQMGLAPLETGKAGPEGMELDDLAQTIEEKESWYSAKSSIGEEVKTEEGKTEQGPNMARESAGAFRIVSRSGTAK